MAAKEEAEDEGKKKKGGIQIPENWPWEEAKKFFLKPDVTPADEVEVHLQRLFRGNDDCDLLMFVQIEWKNPDVDGLVQFLVTEKGFK